MLVFISVFATYITKQTRILLLVKNFKNGADFPFMFIFSYTYIYHCIFVRKSIYLVDQPLGIMGKRSKKKKKIPVL
jgi:hypothetical protein